MAERVIAYIDGFNLYFGLRDKGWKKYLWLDLPALCGALLKPTQTLDGVKYFTTRVSKPADSVRRQGYFLDALDHRGGIEIHYGKFIWNDDGCDSCGDQWTRREEKQTDVNIAVNMLQDAERNDFDAALLISGDSDLVPAVRNIEARQGKRVIVAFPPMRVSDDLRKTASSHFVIGSGAFDSSLLPLLVQTPYRALAQPVEWT